MKSERKGQAINRWMRKLRKEGARPLERLFTHRVIERLTEMRD